MTKFENYNKKILILYIILVFIGLLNLYDLDQWSNTSIFSSRFFKQCVWFTICIVIFFFIHFMETDVPYFFAYPSYVFSVFLILVPIVFGRSIYGHHAWINIGNFTLQPGEFLKISCALAMSKLLGKEDRSLSKNTNTLLISFGLLGFSILIVLLQGDLGSALVFSSFIFPLYVCDLSIILVFHAIVFIILFILNIIFPINFIIACLLFIAFIFILFDYKHLKQILGITLDTSLIAIVSRYIINHFLHQYHKDRIKVLFDDSIDKFGLSWNILQSKIAISNGGLFGRGFGSGTQTKYNFIPAQETDFIFCTIAEEYGFIGVLLYIVVFSLLLFELLNVADKQNFRFNRIFIYSITSILFFHFVVNIAMVSGLFPIVGIPLPFTSYGGSSLVTFSLMIFITLKLDAKNSNVY